MVGKDPEGISHRPCRCIERTSLHGNAMLTLTGRSGQELAHLGVKLEAGLGQH